jgi:hypothetical protein
MPTQRPPSRAPLGAQTLCVLARLVQDTEFCAWFDEHSPGRLHDEEFWIAAGKLAAARWAILQPAPAEPAPIPIHGRRAARG